MDEFEPVALSAVVVDEEWDQALEQALAQIKGIAADVIFLFISTEFADHFSDMLRIVRHETGTPILLGCSATGVIGEDQELEDLPAVSLLALSLPGAHLQPVRLTQEMVEDLSSPQDCYKHLGIERDDVNSWLLFADPFHMDCETLLDVFGRAYPGVPIMGGLAAGEVEDLSLRLFFNEETFSDGGVGLALGGSYSVKPVVSQGCEPIGEAWTITSVQDNGLIEEISRRPAYQMLIETFQTLSKDLQRRAQRNLLVGLAADEYQDSFTRGSFLIRQLLGVDRHTGALAIGALPRVGQTIQFQMRDAASADRDLQTSLTQVKDELGESQPIAALLCTCNGRGMGMFGIPDHDAGLIARELNHVPLAGFFCSGEIAPNGQHSFLHCYTASLALLVKHPPQG